MLFKDSASRVKCKIKARETSFYFQFRGVAYVIQRQCKPSEMQNKSERNELLFSIPRRSPSFLKIMFNRWQESGKRTYGEVCLFVPFPQPFQQVIFQLAKGNLLQGERLPLAMQKATFCKPPVLRPSCSLRRNACKGAENVGQAGKIT